MASATAATPVEETKYEAQHRVNNEVKLKPQSREEVQEPTKAKPFRQLCGRVHKLPTIPAAVDFDELVSRCSATVFRTEAEQIRLESEAILVAESCRITAARSTDASELVYFLKNGLSLPFGPKTGTGISNDVKNAIDSLAECYPPPLPKETDPHYGQMKETHDTSGVYHFAYWMQDDHDTAPTLSRDCLSTGYNLNFMAKFFNQITGLVQSLGLLFLTIDPWMYQTYWTKFQNDLCLYLNVSRRACFHGLALLRNVQVASHKDMSGAPMGWVAITCLGDFSGGNLVFPDLGIKLDFKPGDVIFFRSRLLEHFVGSFEGERSSLVFFTHQDVLDYEDGKRK